MALLAPALLWLLATSPILLFFYVWRARHRRLVAPSTLLWQAALQETEHRASWRLPIRHILLLLELLALAMLAIALARPALSLGRSHHRIVVLDTSLAMNAADVAASPAARPASGSRFAAAGKVVSQMIDRLGYGDTMSLVEAGSLARVVITSGDHDALRHALEGLHAGLGAPDMNAALLLAHQLAVADSQATPSLTLVTSRAAGGGQVTDPCRLSAAPCAVVRLGSSDDDQAVTDLVSSCPSGAAGGDCTVFARVVNFGSHAIREPLRLFADGLPLPLDPADATRTLPAHSSLDLVFSAPRQAHTVELSLTRQDILAADDSRWARLPHDAPPRVLVVSDDPTVLDRALHAIPNVVVSDVTPGSYSDPTATPADLTIFDGWLPDTLTGNALVLGPPAGNAEFPFDHAMTNTRVQGGAQRDPLAQALLQDVDLQALLVAHAPALTLPSWAEPLAMSSQGPLILAGTRPPDPNAVPQDGTAPRLVVVGFNIRDSNLPRLVAFPLLLAHVVDWLAGGAPSGSPLSTTAGQALILGADPTTSGATVRDPQGHPVRLQPSLVDQSRVFLAPDQAGDYPVQARGAGGVPSGSPSGSSHLVVNPDLSGVAGVPSGSPSGSGFSGAWLPGLLATAGNALARQEIWWIVLLAVLALLTLEWYVYARRT